jgi:hypothetical protein
MVSADVAWAVIRNNSAFLLKKRGVKKAFSTEPCNLTNVNSQRYIIKPVLLLIRFRIKDEGRTRIRIRVITGSGSASK